MAFIDIFGVFSSILLGFLVNWFCGNPRYWNIFIVIVVYVVVTSLIHLTVKIYCRAYLSGRNPHHLIVIVTGYLGHYSSIKGIQDSFKYYIRKQKKDNENILVYLSKTNSNGFFFYTFCKSNDGIHAGGKRLSDEIKSIISTNKSINKLSIIGCSLGGIYSRYCLKLLFDSTTNYTQTINGRYIELINFITLASPHLGIVDLFEQSSFCCCFNMYNVCKYLNKCYLLPLTIKEILLLDKQKLLMKMAQDNEYLNRLKLFRNKICFGNAKYDLFVSCKSALMLHDRNQSKLIEHYWNKMSIETDNNFLIQQITKHNIYNIINTGDADDHKFNEYKKNYWFQKVIVLNNEIKWKKYIVCWNPNKCIRNRSHGLLAAAGWEPLLKTIHTNLMY